MERYRWIDKIEINVDIESGNTEIVIDIERWRQIDRESEIEIKRDRESGRDRQIGV